MWPRRLSAADKCRFFTKPAISISLFIFDPSNGEKAADHLRIDEHRGFAYVYGSHGK